MKKINQIIPCFSEGERLSVSATRLSQALRGRGMISDLFDLRDQDAFSSACHSILKLNLKEADSEFVFHWDGEDSLIEEQILKVQGKVTVLCYFSHSHPEGDHWSSLIRVKDRLNRVFADCFMTAESIKRLGFSEVKVLSALTTLDAPLQEFYETSSSNPPLWVLNAPIYPYQRIETAIRLLAWYRKFMDTRAQLLVLGQAVSPGYLLSLRDLAHSVSVQNQVFFLEGLAPEKVAAWYPKASVSLSLAEVDYPRLELIESAPYGVPTLTYLSTSATELFGDSGVYLQGHDIPVFAELIHLVTQDREFRSKIVRKQQLRFKELSLKNTLGVLAEEFLTY